MLILALADELCITAILVAWPIFCGACGGGLRVDGEALDRLCREYKASSSIIEGQTMYSLPHIKER